ncbi:hypothetical protein AMTRI_Chr06g193370 [Amborella trichopoda]
MCSLHTTIPLHFVMKVEVFYLKVLKIEDLMFSCFSQAFLNMVHRQALFVEVGSRRCDAE